MPHRTVFQWGKNHAHPFTMFIGGVVVGALVTGAAAYAWYVSDEVDELDFDDATVEQQAEPQASPTVVPSPVATAATGVQF